MSMRFVPWMALTSACLALAACGVKPRLVYTDADGAQHEVGIEPRRHAGVGREASPVDPVGGASVQEASPGGEARRAAAGPPGWRLDPTGVGAETKGSPVEREERCGIRRGVGPGESAADASPEDDARAHYATAVGLQRSCHYEEALSYLRGYLQSEPDGPHAGRALVRMAEILRTEAYQGYDPERARTLLAEAVARFPGSAAAVAACEMEPSVCPRK